MSISKERREELRHKMAHVSSEFVPAARISELRALLDLADERDRYGLENFQLWHRLERQVTRAERLSHKSNRMESLLEQLSEYFDNYADVTDSDRGVAEVPNEAMEWKQAIDAALEGKSDG